MNALADHPAPLAATVMEILEVRALCPRCGGLAYLVPLPREEHGARVCPACAARAGGTPSVAPPPWPFGPPDRGQ